MQTPIDTRPRITNTAISNQYVTRYFVQSVSNKKIYEVDQVQYNVFKTNPYYIAIQMPWIIAGDANTKTLGSQLILGAIDKNINIVKYYNETMRGLSRKLTNPLEYFVGNFNEQPSPVTTVGATPPTIEAVEAAEEVPVAPVITLSPASMSFSYIIGQSVPQSQSLSVTSNVAVSGLSVVTGSSWLSGSLSSTTTPATINITPVVTGLYSGSYTSTVTVSGTGVSSVSSSVTLSVAYSSSVLFAYEPGMSLSPATFTRATSASYNELVS